jgi:lipid A 3-O-deacylase
LREQAYIFLMVKCLFVILAGLLFFPRQLRAQAIDNSVSYRDVSSEKYFRINYENDFFSAFDRDYTQGILIEKVHPMFKRFFLTKLLWHPVNSEIKYGVAVEQDAYTPNEIDQYDIQYGDRPYAGVLLFKTFLIATNTERKQRITVSLSTGVIGEGAGGEQMQRTIHHWINYTQPQGWHNQIQNDAALNYQVNIEQEICQYENLFSLSAYGSGRVGTLNDKLTGGFTAMLGKFQSPFSSPVILNRRFHWYLYDQLTGNAVGYDATLQGGLFNHTSPYTIPPSQICRLTVQNKFGIVLVFRSLYLEYYHTGLTEEFVTSIYHRTGGLQIGFGF